MKNIIFFSSNKKKIIEINRLFKTTNIKVINLNNFTKLKEPVENGKSFFENAIIKSNYGLKTFKLPCFADDSGICVRALNNKPGIYSKRFLKKFDNKNEAFNYIIKKTIEKKNSVASFITAISLTLDDKQHILFKGELLGSISKKPRGTNGFGYDPIFIPDGYKKTLAELNTLTKNSISHRGIAIQKLINFLSN